MVLLGEKGLLKDWSLFTKVADIYQSLPYKWNKAQKCFMVKNPIQSSINGIRLCISFVYLCLILIQCGLAHDQFSKVVYTHTMLSLAAFLLCFCSPVVNYLHRHAIVGLFNNLIKYEKREKKEAKPEEFHEMTRFLLQQLVIAGFGVPVLYHLDILRNPCFPMYFGYWFSRQCQNAELGVPNEATWSVGEISEKVLILLGSYMQYSFIVPGYSYQIAVEILLHGHCFRSFIDSLGRNWTRPEGKNQLAKHSRKYRQLQIMLIHYRDLYSTTLLLASLAVTLMALETLCLYNSINAVKSPEPVFAGLMVMYVWCAMTCIFDIVLVFGTLADVYQVSLKVHQNVKASLWCQQNKWFKRWFRSCNVLRVYFCGSTFFDSLTPLNLQNFVVQQTVNLLLLN